MCLLSDTNAALCSFPHGVFFFAELSCEQDSLFHRGDFGRGWSARISAWTTKVQTPFGTLKILVNARSNINMLRSQNA